MDDENECLEIISHKTCVRHNQGSCFLSQKQKKHVFALKHTLFLTKDKICVVFA